MLRLFASQSAFRASHSQSKNSPRRTARRAIAPLRRVGLLALFATLAVFGTHVNEADAGSSAQKASNNSAQSLDEQVQEIKSDVLAIAAELSNLEEKLLYPSNTQVAVFVSLEPGQSVDVDSAQISVDGKLVAHHIYSFKEVEALEKGGVQRIYTGNLPTGAHQLDVSILGKRGAGKDFELEQSFAFRKEVDPKLVGITLKGGTVGGTSIEIEDW